ncbi:MAG: OmpH family outer membrane protein [Candidatus Kapabacteria bacterium]|nr:OmpH family outer membrane protein [Candidatus Kapabacteria bacterium]MDW8012193.1 OmpH family outer membrane protein [Bacteroidota bacterium]
MWFWVIGGCCLVTMAAIAQQSRTSQSSSAASPRVAVVDLETIVRQLPEAAQIDRQLMETGQRFRDTLTQLRTELERRLEEYRKREAILTAEAKSKEEEQLRQLQERYLQYQEEKFGVTGELAQLREQLLQPLRTRVQEAIRQVAREEGFQLIIDRSSPTVLFAEDRIDLTYRVLDRLKRGQQ